MPSAAPTPSATHPISPATPPLPPAQAGRLTNLDALRGVCALLVVIIHTLPSYTPIGRTLWPGRPTFYFDLGRIGVGAFFLISGYVIPYSAKPGPKAVQRFWTVRFFRLWPAYWLSIALAVLTHIDGLQLFQPWQIAVNATMLQQFAGVANLLGNYWTLQIELVFYALVTGLLVWGRLHDRRVILACYAACCLLALAVGILRWHTGHKLPGAMPIALAMMFLATYIRMGRLDGSGVNPWLVGSFFVMLVPTCLLGYSGNVEPDDDAMRWIVAYALAVALFLAFERARRAPRVLVLLGAISYSVYLQGDVVVSLCQRLLNNIDVWLVLPVSLIGVTALAAAAFVLVERPAHEYGRRLSKKMG